MALEIDALVLGPLETNCYVLSDGSDCWVVDPGMGPGPLLRFLNGAGMQPAGILLTHGHGDHVGGLGEVKARFPAARVLCPAGDAAMLPDPEANMSAPFGMPIVAPEADELIQPGQTLRIGRTDWQVLDTSGHTPGGVSFYCPQAKAVITGDALFAGSIGRVDLPGGGAARLLRNIRQNLLSLPDETRVLPGHGPQTTIGAERRTNPFFTEG